MEIQINQTEYTNVIENNSTVLLDFYTDWCGPCRTLLPTIHKLADELKDNITIKKINVDNNQELAAKFGIRNIPTLVFIKDGKAVEKHTGLITERNLRSKIDRLK
ncbi:MAG: thioredoxin [Polaribacter sp.]|uniref:thioredoxin n=1 Tax=Polaribacter sp. TaxID=1920175 RepID=UPI0032655A3C